MTTNLKHSHGQRTSHNCFCWHSNSRKADYRRHEQQAIQRDEAKLDERKRHGVAELCKDGFASVG